ncbi:PAS domain-containing protein [Granulicella sp. dw_53]|uniref:PAS domain-containing protein n=1 Tax=Granulicella sp. dw_53 TaxID=2719792 RepID=UPI001BD3F286|nr:PAS domain-containing protein [Granulicella sp. dw_53]
MIPPELLFAPAPKQQGTSASSPAEGSQDHKFLQLLDHIPDAILAIDRSWKITFVNAEARRISRITPADLNARTYWELFPEAVGSDLETCYRQSMSKRTSSHIEHFYEPFQLWLDIHVFPVEDGITLYYRDITDRKLAEAGRDDAVRKLRQVFESTPDSIVCIDRNWNCTFANRAAHVILKTDNLIGTNLWAAFPLNQTEPYISNYRTTMERGIPTEFEAHYPAPLNAWFKVFVRPFEDGIIIFSSDITARKKAEARRDATTRQLQQVFEATTDAVASISHDWTYTFLNRRAEELLVKKGDLIGKNVWEEFPASRDTEFFYNYLLTMEQRIPTEFEAFYAEPLNMWLHVACRPSDDGMVVFFRDITARRHSDHILKQQRDLLSVIQEAALVATWELDLASGNITYSDGSYPVHGHPLDSVATRKDFERVIPPDHLEVVSASLRDAMYGNDMVVLDFPTRAADGSLRWLETRAKFDQHDGKVVALRGMTIDITDRKRNEDALAASEERYRVLADLNPQAIWMGSPQGAITYANQRFLDYVGLTLEQLSGDGWLDPYHRGERPRVAKAWTNAIATGSEYEIEARMIRASDQAVRWWWLRALPVRDDSGKILHWLGVANDIHDRKTYADQLQVKQLETERQRAELETVYATAPIGLALFDPVEFRYLRLNDRQAAFFGMSPSQVVGKTLTEMAPIPGLHEMFEQVAQGRPIVNQLLEGRVATDPPDRTRFWTVNYYPVYDTDGTIQAISAASLEITNQKKAEAALIQSEKLAAVGRLASSISHEINNPLEAITNILYLIDGDPILPNALRPLVHTAQSELARVCQIATQTLRFHRQAVRATHVTPQTLVGPVLDLYQGRLSNSNIHVQASYTSLTSILCFENDIRQVLNNLIANAIDAMRQGGRLIVRAHDATLHTEDRPKGVRGVRITIADTGHGMSPEVRSRIFEPFFTTKDLNGTGLGLWISDGIIARHKGRLTLRSSTHPIHHGTIFSLLLPTEDEPAPSMPA